MDAAVVCFLNERRLPRQSLSEPAVTAINRTGCDGDGPRRKLVTGVDGMLGERGRGPLRRSHTVVQISYDNILITLLLFLIKPSEYKIEYLLYIQLPREEIDTQ